MASRQTPGPNTGSKPDPVSKTPPPKPSSTEDLGDLSDLGVLESMTLSALTDAVMGKKNLPTPAVEDDDDALGLGASAPTSGPPSGILRPSALPDDDALSLEMQPTTPGNESSLSFVARSDVRSGDQEIEDVIATNPIKPSGKTPAWFAPPKSGKLRPSGAPLSGKLLPLGDPSLKSRDAGNDGPTGEPSDIFSGSRPAGTSIPHAGDSNLLSVMAGSGQGESSNILSNLSPDKIGNASDLFGDSRILTDSNPNMPRPVSSDILSGSKDLDASDILTGSSLFDQPSKQTDKLSGSASVTSQDSFVPLFDNTQGSSIVLNQSSLQNDADLPGPADVDAGMISFDIPKKTRKANSSGGDAVDVPDDTDDERTGFMAIPEDEDDALSAEFLTGGDRSGVNLLSGAFDHQETMSSDDDGDSSEDVFNARTVMDIDIDAGSGLNLLSQKPEKFGRGGPPKSESIFGPLSGKIDVKTDGSEVIPNSNPRSTNSIFGSESGVGGPSSGIFPSGKNLAAKAGQVNFDIPDKTKDRSNDTDRVQASGMIDWSKGSNDSQQLPLRSQVTDQMSQAEELRTARSEDTSRTPSGQQFELEESDSVFDVKLPEDSSTESQLFKVEQYAKAAAAGAAVAESGIIAGRSGRLPKVEPVSSRTKFVPPPPVRKSNLGWLGGSAAGLLAGVGISSAAYFGGLAPGKGNVEVNLAQVAEVRREYEGKLSQAIANQNAAVEEAKAEALKDSRKTEQELAAKLTTAQSTAKSANEARDLAVRNLEAARKDAATANSKVDEVRAEVSKVAQARDQAVESLKPLQMKLTAAEQTAKSAAEQLTAATSRYQTADAALTSAVKELQSAGLIDAKTEPAQAVAMLPAAIRNAAARGTGVEAKKLQELSGQLISAKKEAETARTEATAAKARADLAVAETKTRIEAATEKLQKELATAKASSIEDVNKAVASATKVSQAKLDTLAADLRRERDERKAEVSQYEAKLLAQAEEFRQQLVAARAGIQVALTDGERVAAERSARLFGVGTDAYFEGRFADAIAALTDATKANPSDARAWYYLGLSQWMSGDKNGAALSYQTAAKWESRSTTAARQVGPALERVQGPARTFLETFRP